MFDHIVILTLEPFKPAIFSVMERFCDGQRYDFVFTRQELAEVLDHVTKNSVLISFGNGVIVPQSMLNRFGAAYNFHPASPEYPGLHPHHFAALDNARTFGAVCHKMTKEIDEGEIVLCKRFNMPENAHWVVYLNLALDETFALIEVLFETLFVENKLPQPCGEKWGTKHFTKNDFFKACQVPLDVSKEKLTTMLRAMQVDTEENMLYIDLHGHRFRYEKMLEGYEHEDERFFHTECKIN